MAKVAVPKIIVVTGVSRGCGLAMTRGFIERGHTVCGCCRSEASAKDLGTQYPAPHRFVALDVTDNAAVKQWADAVLAVAGPPDLIVNNAALINRVAPLWEVPAEEFSNIIDVNIKGVANVIRHFVPAMVVRRAGVIVNFSSGWGRSTAPEVAPYCATKYAIEGLTQSLAQELPDGMAAVPLNPGIINTDMLRICWAEDAASYPSPEQWSRRAVPFLLSLGPNHNGQSLSVP